ncbi:MAG: DUF1700 domain-containing protein [Clostridia bacterium]|nr:DUF1700 domain-containing protein [Clostridia bacterium]
MTRREYLTALNQYLVTMSESEKMAILKEYDDHFRKGFEAGKTESQVCASLGAPYDVANEFLEGRHPKAPTYPTQSRPQTAQPRPQTHSSSDYIGSSHRQTFTTRTGVSQPRPQTSSTPASTQTPQDIFSEPTYPQPQRPAYSEPSYPQTQRPACSEPSYPQTQRSAYVPDDQAYVDYDRAESEREIEPKKKKRESKYSMTGIIVVAVIGVLLVPTMGFAIYYLVRGLYELLRAFPGTGVALIAAGGSLSANSLWICLGLIFIGISFLALTGLLIMAIIEITKLFIKLFRYILKECKKMIKEGSF